MRLNQEVNSSSTRRSPSRKVSTPTLPLVSDTNNVRPLPTEERDEEEVRWKLSNGVGLLVFYCKDELKGLSM